MGALWSLVRALVDGLDPEGIWSLAGALWSLARALVDGLPCALVRDSPEAPTKDMKIVKGTGPNRWQRLMKVAIDNKAWAVKGHMRNIKKKGRPARRPSGSASLLLPNILRQPCGQFRPNHQYTHHQQH